jgi:NADH-quinone oxidoreductase subunit I
LLNEKRSLAVPEGFHSTINNQKSTINNQQSKIENRKSKIENRKPPPWWYPNLVMPMPSLLRKVFLLDLLQGLKVTFRYQDPKEIYTEQYPLERPQVAERYRGAPRLNVNPDTDETMCIACDLCALACPEHLIVVSSERNEKTRRKELTNFTYDLSRCMFCGLCEDACPTDALELTQDFELASYDRKGWIWDRETLEKGPQPTLYQR